MNDNDIDQRLRDHGATWREGNKPRTGVDWETVTGRSRSKVWLAVAGTVAAVAAVVVPLVLVSAGGSTAQVSPAAARVGAPAGFFALADGRVNYIHGGIIAGFGNGAIAALGVRPSGSRAYFAERLSGCRSSIGTGEVLSNGVPRFTDAGPVIQARVGPVPMAVSPDGRQLAFIVNQVVSSAACVPVTQVDVMDLETHALRMWTGPNVDDLSDLSWSPDGSQLSYRLASNCFGGCTASDYSDAANYGTHVLDVSQLGASLDAAPLVLSQRADPRATDGLGPVFWWHGHLVAVAGGALRPVEHGKLGLPLATGLPELVDTVSSDISGNHLLATGYRTRDLGLSRVVSAVPPTFRWDHGRLTSVAAPLDTFPDGRGAPTPAWVQPGW